MLRIHNAEKLEVMDKAQIGTYSFNYVKYIPKSRTLKFIACEGGCEISIAVSSISIDYAELEYRGKARITYGRFLKWERSDSKVYE